MQLVEREPVQEDGGIPSVDLHIVLEDELQPFQVEAVWVGVAATTDGPGVGNRQHVVAKETFRHVRS